MTEDFVELPQFEVDVSAASLLPLEYCVEKQVVILGAVPPDVESPVIVGAINPRAPGLAAELTVRLGRAVRLVQLNEHEVRRAQSRMYQLPLVRDESGLLRVDAERQIEFARGQSANKLLEDLLAVAIRRRASDVHIEQFYNDVDLRFRIDGVMHQVTTPLSPDNVTRVVSRIKVLSQLDLAEHRRAQDGRFSVAYRFDGRLKRVDCRATILPGLFGQDVALRLLDPERFILELEGVSMPAEVDRRWRRLIHYPHGLLLTTGPTGAGKTTTLYATLEALRSDNLKIVTVEDPVEYEFPKISQKNVSPQMGFADYLRAFLRSNPDIMLVGEIRDSETAEIAIRAATTGHLILSTLHTGDAIAAVGRLRVLGIPNDFLADVLIGVLGQRLVRRLCPECREEGAPPERLVPLYYEKPPRERHFRARGCERCGGTGYAGLRAVFELLQPNDAVTAAIDRGLGVEELRRVAVANGWVPLVEDALRLVRDGVTTLEEVARRIPPKFPFRG